jgi:hypothetical protein
LDQRETPLPPCPVPITSCHPLATPSHSLVTPSPPLVTNQAEYRPPCSGRRASSFSTGPSGLHIPPRLSYVPAALALTPHHRDQVPALAPDPIRPLPLSPDLLERSVSPELQYPSSPAPQSPTIYLVSPDPPISVVGTPELHPASPSPVSWLPPDSPIDYEAAACRVEFYEAQQRLEQEHLAATAPRPPSPPVDQENQATFPVPRPPSCFHATGQHPHQNITVHTSQGEEWRPISESYQGSIHNIQTAEQLSTAPPHFPSVFPFRSCMFHCLTIIPRYLVTLTLGVVPLIACSQAVLDLPSGDLPLGWIKYNFHQGIHCVFAPLPLWYRQAYTHALVVLEVQDFLDSRVVTTYGYLTFIEDWIFMVEQGYHFEDTVRAHPHLLSHTLSPRIPTDPFDFVSVHPDDLPL